VQLVRQRGDSDCGVATFAMLTDRTYEAALDVLGYEADVPDHTLRVHLQMDGWFVREVWRIEESLDGSWPPPPFAERHWAMVTQPSGNGHYVAMEADGAVLDPLSDQPRRLQEWSVCSVVCGIVRYSVPVPETVVQALPSPRSDCHGFDQQGAASSTAIAAAMSPSALALERVAIRVSTVGSLPPDAHRLLRPHHCFARTGNPCVVAGRMRRRQVRPAGQTAKRRLPRSPRRQANGLGIGPGRRFARDRGCRLPRWQGGAAVRARAIYFALVYGLRPWWMYESESHYAPMSYRQHLAMNLGVIWRWSTGRETEDDRHFERAVNG
jgi:hypothetical protein